MGAITTAIWTLLKPGDEILADMTLYGATFSFFHGGLEAFGITERHADLTDLDTMEAVVTARTKLVYFEAPANPNLRLVDIAGVAERAHARGILVMVDGTYSTPVLQRPIELGADLVVHSATKYLGGHSDLLAGAVLGRHDLIERMRSAGLRNMTGAVLSPFNAFLLLRGFKTLELRMERHCSSAGRLARFLSTQSSVARVNYPGLEDSPYHALARPQMAGYGGMISFELKGGFEAGVRFMNGLRLVTIAVSLGDAETLVEHPASMTYSTYTPDQRLAHGIDEGLVRLSVGLESVNDLEEDIGAALDALP